MKKILVVNIGTEIGGIEKCLINFLYYLETRDCQVDLLLWKPAGPLFSQIPKSVHILDRPGPGSFREILKTKSIKGKLSKMCIYISYKKWNKQGQAWKSLPRLAGYYDVAISYCQNGYSPYYVLDNVDAGQKYMFYHHGSYDKDKRNYEFDKRAYSRFDKIITVSRANKDMLSQHFPSLMNHIEVIHNLIDEENILRKANEPIKCFENSNVFKITTVGRLSVEKGQSFALKVAVKLRERGLSFEWIFVGDGPDKEENLQFVYENELSCYCRFVGAKENPYPYVQQADLYVQSSSVEADPTTIHEAKVLHKKIVASDIPAIREVLKGVRGAKLSKLDVDSFVEAIEFMVDSETIICASKENINMQSLKKMDSIFGL